MASPLVRSHRPICGLERARELKFNLATTSVCAPQNSSLPDGTKVRGCPKWESCRFDRPAYGGFKGDRPHLIGVYTRTIEGNASKDWMACSTFVSALQSRMDFGIAMRNAGMKNFEVIKIIAQEGEMIDVRRTTSELGKDGKIKWVTKRATVPVPVFPDPTEVDPSIEYERDIMEDMEGDTMTLTTAGSRPMAEPSKVTPR